jgi:hypothetical protein
MTTREEIICIEKVFEREKWFLSERLGHDCGEDMRQSTQEDFLKRHGIRLQ